MGSIGHKLSAKQMVVATTRIYDKKASDFHLHVYIICASDIPFRAACEVAPILKLCVLYRDTLLPRKYKDLLIVVANISLDTGRPEGRMKSGPGELLRYAR